MQSQNISDVTITQEDRMKIIPLIVVLVKRSALQMKVKVMLVKIQFKMKLEVWRRLMMKSWKTIGQLQLQDQEEGF